VNNSIIQVARYEKSDKEQWNVFIKTTRQQSILFNRNYMDYHQAKFTDHSLLFYLNNKIIAVLPANEKSAILYSHQGLTFGGLLFSKDTKSSSVVKIISALISYLKNINIIKMVYKPSPSIYHQCYSDDDIYALFKVGDLMLNSVEITTVITPNNRGKISNVRQRGIKKSINNDIIILQDISYLSEFYSVLKEGLLNNYNVQPVHTLEELKLLFNNFSNEIKLWSAMDKEKNIVAGVIIYESETTSHFQYISTSQKGRETAALDLLCENIIIHYSNKNKIIDFGKSTEDQGQYLNEGLIYQKESFGGFSTNYNTYTLTINY